MGTYDVPGFIILTDEELPDFTESDVYEDES